jgi:hypothetical protein
MPMQAFIALLAAVVAAAEVVPQQFVGTWTRTFNGQLQVWLELREEGGTLTGRINLGTVHADRDGNVDAVIEPAAAVARPIFDVALRDNVLSFGAREPEDGHTDHFELRLAGDDLELRFFPTPEIAAELARQGRSPLKPIRLTRSSR